MNPKNLKGDSKDIVLSETLGLWLDGAARMMSCLAVMRRLELVDEEEERYLMGQISAATRIGATALGATANTSLETFIEKAMAINNKAGGKIDAILREYSKDILDKPGSSE